MRRRILTILLGISVLAIWRTAASASPGDPLRPRPQEPVGARPYTEHLVSYESAPGVRIAATLTVPRGGATRAAAVLTGGTGPQDRDANIAGHRPFLVIADHLARQGVAVLRFDKRGVGGSTGALADATPLDFAADVIAGVEFLASHPATRTVPIGVIGHSEGGMIAPIAANRSRRVAFLVLLAAPGLPMREIGVRQAEAIARAEGVPEADVAARVKLSAAILDLFASNADAATITTLARPILEEGFARIPLDARARARQVDLALSHYASPWAHFALRYDPAPALRSVQVPVLALNGSLDVQIEARTNLPAIAAALGGGHVTTHELPRLNHLFQTAQTGGLGEYARISETFSPIALRIVSDWILDQASTGVD
jgi:uncharacterized protein